MTEKHRNSRKMNFLWCFLIGVGIFMCLSMVQAVSECDNNDLNTMRNGNEVLKSDWPFIGALYVRPNRFRCAGTVLSKKHVLTTAQCVHLKNLSTKYNPTDIIVRLGITEIDGGMQIMNVSKIQVHEDWQPYGDRSNADIAVVVLSNDVTFNRHVQPIRLPADDVVSYSVEYHIIGWTNAENEKTHEIPTDNVSGVINNSYSHRNESSIARDISLRSFCAEYGEVPNITDNGAGVFVLSQSHWVQFGIIATTQTHGTGHVSSQSAATFTTVKSFTTWIKAIVEKNEIYRCLFDFRTTYNCELVTAAGTTIRNASYHINGKTNEDVDTISIPNFIEFPTGRKIGQTFPNLKKLKIIGKSCDHRLTRIRSSTNFENMENLTELYFDFGYCDVNFDIDFLKNLPNLEKIIFESAPYLPFRVNETTFQAKSSLKAVEIYVMGSIPWNLFRNNLMLEEVKLVTLETEIDERLFEANVNLRKFILLSYWQMKSLPWNLFRNNLMLEHIGLVVNHCTEIDERMFKANVELRSVYISGKVLKSLPWNLFEANVELRRFDISGDELKSLPWNLFKNNLMLEEVHVMFSGISQIDERTFETNEKLRSVKMYFCSLEFLPKDLFKNNLKLEFIDFDGNNLKIIEIDFTVLKNVGYIKLKENTCIDSKFSKDSGNLIEFQRKINSSCISNSSSDRS